MSNQRPWCVTFALFVVVLAATVVRFSVFDVNQFETVFLSAATTSVGLAAWGDYRRRDR